VPEPARLLAPLIRARRSGDRAAVAAALTRLRRLGIPIQYGDTLPPPRSAKCPARPVAG
jgi:hypothetical protein